MNANSILNLEVTAFPAQDIESRSKDHPFLNQTLSNRPSSRSSGPKTERMAKRIGFDTCFLMEANCFSGGLCLFWNKDGISIDVTHYENQWIHFSRKSTEGHRSYTVVYAHPNPTARKFLWGFLEHILESIRGP
ncbi:hypothetical protein Scep_029886 [Stephania cephalantha]|uniref:Uncharacterized protein n=1 Tax=Stephania cephalantha TaxID=152367 RepID=A0AAP0HI25_9MAGN